MSVRACIRTMRRRCRPAVAAAVLALSTTWVLAPLPAWAQAPDAAFDAALQAYERNHWAQAWAALVRLGDQGHPQAARMALDMWRFGRRLYGIEFEASAQQVERWTRVWGCVGDVSDRTCALALTTP